MRDVKVSARTLGEARVNAPRIASLSSLAKVRSFYMERFKYIDVGGVEVGFIWIGVLELRVIDCLLTCRYRLEKAFVYWYCFFPDS